MDARAEDRDDVSAPEPSGLDCGLSCSTETPRPRPNNGLRVLANASGRWGLCVRGTSDVIPRNFEAPACWREPLAWPLLVPVGGHVVLRLSVLSVYTRPLAGAGTRRGGCWPSGGSCRAKARERRCLASVLCPPPHLGSQGGRNRHLPTRHHRLRHHDAVSQMTGHREVAVTAVTQEGDSRAGGRQDTCSSQQLISSNNDSKWGAWVA